MWLQRASIPCSSPANETSIFSSWLLINVVVAAILAATFAIFGDQISSVLFGEATYGREVFLTALIVSAGLLRNLALGVLRNITRAVSYAVLSGAGITANASACGGAALAETNCLFRSSCTGDWHRRSLPSLA